MEEFSSPVLHGELHEARAGFNRKTAKFPFFLCGCGCHWWVASWKTRNSFHGFSISFPKLWWEQTHPTPPFGVSSSRSVFSVQNHQLIFSNATNWEFPFLVSWGISHWISMWTPWGISSFGRPSWLENLGFWKLKPFFFHNFHWAKALAFSPNNNWDLGCHGEAPNNFFSWLKVIKTLFPFLPLSIIY